MTDRLTPRDWNTVGYDPWELCGLDGDCKRSCIGCRVLKMILRLAKYEDREEKRLQK